MKPKISSDIINDTIKTLSVISLLVLPTVGYGEPGNLDLTFGQSGTVTTKFPSSVSGDRALGGAIQSDGKIVAVGYGDPDFQLARYNGKIRTGFSPGGYDVIFDIMRQSDGKIVAIGTSSDTFALARYLP
jgi:Domain of unknown function (DUF5122) beta-propeller